MNRFWKSVIEPLLNAVEPQTIVEVGCERGGNTRNLVQYCSDHHCSLHVVDPAPAIDDHELERWSCQMDFAFMLHEARSLDVLPALESIDVVLLDGDHNWYTVYHELQAIEAASQRGDGKLPLVVLHDVGWPYGRRDLYYRPDDIPERYRQPYAPEGMHPHFNALTASQGFNVGAANAKHEGGTRNGVLTAVEDFISGSSSEWSFHMLPVFHGLGILCPAALTAWNEELSRLLERMPEQIVQHGLVEAVEEDRVLQTIESADLRRVLASSLGALEGPADEACLLPKLDATLEVLFRSWRWRIGNFLVSAVRKLLRRSPGDDVQAILHRLLEPARQRMALRYQDRMATSERWITRQFHDLYCGSEQRTRKETHWLGTSVQKCPLDLWVYQEIIQETKPDLIIETGTCDGGSALFMASVCEQVGHGHVLSIDMRPQANRPAHPRLRYRTGDSVAGSIVREVERLAMAVERVMVILDSDHSRDHVLAELKAYGPLVTEGCYLVVEDTNLAGVDPGAREAVHAFLHDNHDFAADPAKEKFLMTFNPGGYLRRLTARAPMTRDGEPVPEHEHAMV